MRISIVLITIFCAISLALFIAYRGLYGAPEITVINATLGELQKVTVSVRGRSKSTVLGSLRAGESKSVIIQMSGESSITVTYTKGGEELKAENLGYIEGRGGYCATITLLEGEKPTFTERFGCFRFGRLIQ
jgi:hypothetical protein